MSDYDSASGEARQSGPDVAAAAKLLGASEPDASAAAEAEARDDAEEAAAAQAAAEVETQAPEEPEPAPASPEADDSEIAEVAQIAEALEAAAEPVDEATPEDATADEDEEEDPVETLRRELRTAFGDWYVVHSYAGYENKVKANLESRIQSLDMEDYIFQVEVPTVDVVEIKNGKRQQVQRKVFPGYILVRMELNDESWGAVRNTPGVTGFVGATSRPSPLSLDEVVKILAPATQKAAAVGRGAGTS